MLENLTLNLNNFLHSFNWLTLAISGYFLIALVNVLDKYLLHSRISKPAVYAFYVAMFSLFALFFAPFGFYYPGIYLVLAAFLSGLFFIYGLVAFYSAAQENEISRVAPLVGTVIPLVSIFYASAFSGEKLGAAGVIAIFILVLGCFLISFDLPIHNLKFFRGFKYSLISGILQAMSLGLLKVVFNETNFINGFVWNRIGFFLAGLSLLLLPQFRLQIIRSFKYSRKNSSKAVSTGSIFTLNKVLAGIGSFLIVLAISGGSVSAVNAVGSIQFVFVLALVAVLSIRFHDIYKEKMELNDWIQKILAIALIGVGIWILAGNGKDFFLLTS